MDSETLQYTVKDKTINESAWVSRMRRRVEDGGPSQWSREDGMRKEKQRDAHRREDIPVAARRRGEARNGLTREFIRWTMFGA